MGPSEFRDWTRAGPQPGFTNRGQPDPGRNLVIDVRSGQHRVLTATPARTLAYSADGQQLAASDSGGKLTVMDATDGRQLWSATVAPADAPFPTRIDVSGDGRWVSCINASARRLNVFNLATGQPRFTPPTLAPAAGVRQFSARSCGKPRLLKVVGSLRSMRARAPESAAHQRTALSSRSSRTPPTGITSPPVLTTAPGWDCMTRAAPFAPSTPRPPSQRWRCRRLDDRWSPSVIRLPV